MGEIAEAVTQLLSDPRKAAELGASARRQVLERYSWEARLAPLDEILGIRQRPVGAPNRTAA